MWWDWTQITLFESILFSILAIGVLYFIGFGTLKLIQVASKTSDALAGFDFAKRTNFRLLFGVIFTFLFLYLFSSVNVPFAVSTVIVMLIAGMGFIVDRRSLKIVIPKITLSKHVQTITTMIVFLVIVFSSATLITGFYGSTIDDAADHTLLVRVIIDNPQSLLTRSAEPYANIALNYPVATHALSAFFVTLLGVSIQKIVLLVSITLPGLIAISFYSTIKCIFENKLLAMFGLVIAGFFTVSLFWAPITWGGLPLLLSLYLSVAAMGLMYSFMVKRRMTVLNAFLIGLIFFIASRTYPIALLIITLWFVLVTAALIAVKLRKSDKIRISYPRVINKRNVAILVAFLVPLMLSIPYFFFVVTRNAGVIQSGALDSVSTSAAQAMSTRIAFNWLLDIPALSSFFSLFGQLFIVASLALPLILVLVGMHFSSRMRNYVPRRFLHGLLIVYCFLLLIFGYLALTLYLPIGFLTSFLNPERVWQHMIMPTLIMAAAVLFSGACLLFLVVKRLLHSGATKLARIRNRLIVCCLLFITVVSVFLGAGPVVSGEAAALDISSDFMHNRFQTLFQDDVSMLQWIKENIPPSQRILVSSGDSGQYVSSVTQRLTVSYYSRYANYTTLMELLIANASAVEAIPFLLQYNVSYVYIGSKGVPYALELPYYRQFNSTQFLTSPFFTLKMNFGDVYLFEFNSSVASTLITNTNPGNS